MLPLQLSAEHGQISAMETAPSSRPVLGVVWMLITGVLFVGVTAIVKVLGTRIPAPEAAFLRYALGLVFLIPMLRPMMNARLTARQIKIFAFRGIARSARQVLPVPVADAAVAAAGTWALAKAVHVLASRLPAR